METLEVIISPDGRVEARVSGVSGQSCLEVTASLESDLGTVVHRELTVDYFASEASVSTALPVHTLH
ncbi:MAG: DUF2997 domain-containing protein [Gloeomargaritaceae cyanobacterium C42_A2020_066]|nr:DUF2997 domain-containing protein [Gloeomargaritaceae cyanobacterium C42_A2020_066]